MVEPQDNSTPTPPPGFTPVQSAGDNVPPPPPGFSPVQSAAPPPGFKPVSTDSGQKSEEASGSGAGAGIARAAKNLWELPGHVWDALTQDPQTDEEKMIATEGIDHPNGHIPGKLALPLHRLFVVPQQQAIAKGEQYEQMAKTEPNPKIKKQLLDAAGVYKLGGAVPMIGPMAAQLAERGAYGKEGASKAGEGGSTGFHNKNSDLAGAETEALTYSAIPEIAKQVKNLVLDAVMPKTAPAPTQTITAADTTAKALPAKEAGQTVQAEAKATRDVAGKKVAAAKEAVQSSVEAKRNIPAAGEGATKALQKLSSKSTPVEPKALTKSTETVLKDTADAEQLAGAKDPDMADVRSMAEHLSKGQNAAGDPLSLDSDQVESMKRAFNQKIDALQAKADAGGNATALRHLKNLKQAWQDDLYDAYEQHGDPEAAKNLRAASKEYAKVVDDQTSGPARTMFRNQSPEKTVSTIVGSGARSQSAVESLVRNMSDAGRETLRDSVLKEIYRKNTLPDGSIDMVKARKNFYSLGDTAKTLYGDNLKQITDFLDAASKQQMKLNAKAGKPSLVSSVTNKVGKAAGAGAGAGVGSIAGTPGAVAGAIAGSELADAVFQNGKSGAVKIGISPTERIVLSPAQASAARPAITRFLKAKSAGNAAAMTAAYNAIANPVRKPDNKP